MISFKLGKLCPRVGILFPFFDPGAGVLHWKAVPGAEGLEYNLTGRFPFFKSLHNPFRKKIAFLIPCFGIFRLQNNRKTIWKTIAYCFKAIAFCSWTTSHNPSRNFWSIFSYPVQEFMLKDDTLKNGTSRIGFYGSAPPVPGAGIFKEKISEPWVSLEADGNRSNWYLHYRLESRRCRFTYHIFFPIILN